MIGFSALRFQREAALGRFAHQQRIAGLQLVQQRSERAFGHKLEEKFHFIFERSRGDRIRALHAFSAALHSQRGVLPGNKLEVSTHTDAEHPQVRCKIDAPGNLRVVKLVVRSCHVQEARPPIKESQTLSKNLANADSIRVEIIWGTREFDNQTAVRIVAQFGISLRTLRLKAVCSWWEKQQILTAKCAEERPQSTRRNSN